MDQMSKVTIITTGGTIASGRDPESGQGRMVQGQQLIGGVPGISGLAEIEVEEFCRVGSSQMLPADMFYLSRRVSEVLGDPAVAGAVVTHGTDTLEETAMMLATTIDSPKPVVVTGAMRVGQELGSDGPRNIWASVRTVLSPEAGGRGVLVVLNDDILAAHEATKAHSSRPDTFEAPGFGPLGRSDLDGVVFFREPSPCAHIPAERVETNVDLIKSAAGMDARYVEASVAGGAKGIVVEGMGKGNVPRLLAEGLVKAARLGVVVVMVTRCREGGVAHSGALGDAVLVWASGINGQKARIKLMVALGYTVDPAEVRKIWSECTSPPGPTISAHPYVPTAITPRSQSRW
jgi:L-asparaginase